MRDNYACPIKKIGRRARQLRIERGLTLEQAESAGWPSWTHLRRIEAGKNFTVESLLRLADLYGVHPSDLLKDL